MKELVLTNLTKVIPKKNIIAAGYWIDDEKINHLSYHWKNKKKLNKDYKYLTKLSEEIIFSLIKKLNLVHKENKSIRYWRIILSPWLHVYLSSMYDRWETINYLIKTNDNYKCDYFFSKKILRNFGVIDYIEKVTTSDLWNHSNFLRIIEYKKTKKISFKDNKNLFVFKNNLKKIKRTSLNHYLDNILSYVSLFFNSTIIENFYISKKDYFNLCLNLKLFPGIFKNFFKSGNLNKSNFDHNLRNNIFKLGSNKKNFHNFLFECLKNDFPTTYLENYKKLKNEINNKGYQIKKTKKIFSMTSFISNEIFKLWLANKIENGSKFIIASHGGCLNPELNGFFNYFPKIADKIITRKKSLNPKEIQMPLLKTSYNNFNSGCENIYIFDCEPAKYPCKIQSWPFISDYKAIIKNTEELINLFSKKDKKNIFYRSMNNGKNFAKIIKKKIPNINLSDLKREKFKDIKNDIKLAICMYPETVIVDLITSGIPTLIYIPKNLYSFDKNSNKMIKYLKRNNIYFDNLKNLKLHLNKIINSPNDWWLSKSNQLILKKFKNDFFKMEEDYILKWNQIIKKI